MPHAIRMPKPGQMTEECTVILWRVAEGERVRRGDVLFEIETDKATMEVEAFDEGTLLRIVAPAGTTVPVNGVCAWVGEPGDSIPADEARPPVAAPAPPPGYAPAPEPAPAGGAPVGSTATRAPVPEALGERLRISPRAARAAAAAGIDPRSIAGSGPAGRIVERDILAIAAARGARGPSVGVGTTSRPRPPVPGEGAPEPLSRLRRKIAERLTESWRSTPQFTATVAADVTALLALRSELRSAGVELSVTDFVLAATAGALVEHPELNARTDGISVWPRRRVHLGLAVAVPGGLLVPVIRDADLASIRDLHDRAADLAARGREGTLGPDELSGSTFTVSNLGMFGVESFSAIVNPGEAAILAVASAVPTPVAIGDALAVRTLMRLTISADHRLVDGEAAARFLSSVRRRLEDPEPYRAEAAFG